MRDPARIDKFCDELKTLWHKVPDQRFGQFMLNILGEVSHSSKRDVFFIEDAEMLAQMKEVSWLKD